MYPVLHNFFVGFVDISTITLVVAGPGPYPGTPPWPDAPWTDGDLRAQTQTVGALVFWQTSL